jgi:hypothetical protein
MDGDRMLELVLAAQLSIRAIAAYPAYDPLRANPPVRVFAEAVHNSLVRPLENAYAFDSCVAASEDDLYALDLQGAKLLVMMGHGTVTSIALDAEEDDCTRECDEKKYIDMSDEAELRTWFSSADPDLVIVLPDCWTGYGENNLSQMVKRAAQGRRVVASDAPVIASRIEVDSAYPLKVRFYTPRAFFRHFVDVESTYEP